MHIVLVIVTIHPSQEAVFREALLHNARESVAKDPGCVRFDVSQDAADPARWILHEVYETPDAHQRHRQSAHFLDYDRVAAEAVVEKMVIKAIGHHVL